MRNDLTHWLRGFAMGCADVVPGVSGGTVALILGIYQRLVTALSRFDRQFVAHLSRGQMGAAAAHIDLRFLAALAAGVVCGVAGMLLAVNQLLNSPTGRPLVMAAFFGMIVASCLLVIRMIQPSGTRQRSLAAVAGAVGIAAALAIGQLQAVTGPTPGPTYLFLCGAVAICAMILPGISGAMVLLLLGAYQHVSDAAHALLHFDDIAANALVVAATGAGCVVGLLAFSKALRWLLQRHYVLTMSALCGVMAGSLPKVWPFQIDQTPLIPKVSLKTFEPFVPTAWDGPTLKAAGIAAAAAASVLLFEFVRTQRSKRGAK